MMNPNTRQRITTRLLLVALPVGVFLMLMSTAKAITTNEQFSQLLLLAPTAATANSQNVFVDENGLVRFNVRLTNASTIPTAAGTQLKVELLLNTNQVAESESVTVRPNETKTVVLNHTASGLTGGCTNQVYSVRVTRTPPSGGAEIKIVIEGLYPRFTRRNLTISPGVPQTLDHGQSRTFNFNLSGLGTTTTPSVECYVRARWTTPSVEIPPQGSNPRPMSFVIRKPGGQVALQRDQTTGVDFVFNITAADLAAGGQWAIEFTNPGVDRIVITSLTGQIGHCFFN